MKFVGTAKHHLRAGTVGAHSNIQSLSVVILVKIRRLHHALLSKAQISGSSRSYARARKLAFLAKILCKDTWIGQTLVPLNGSTDVKLATATSVFATWTNHVEY